MTKMEFARTFHSQERVTFVSSLPCIGCHIPGISENHHIKNGGMGRKANYTFIIPLCRNCHNEWHQHGRITFELRHRIDALEMAVYVQALWEGHRSSVVAGRPETCVF